MRRFAINEILKNSGVLSNQDIMPFQVTYQGRVVAEVVPPGMRWPECEYCGEVTPNVFQFKSDGKWEKLILCDKCKAKLL